VVGPAFIGQEEEEEEGKNLYIHISSVLTPASTNKQGRVAEMCA
jgi:hypothetical protein